MAVTCEGPPVGERGGPETIRLATERSENDPKPAWTQVSNRRAVREAKLCLLREAIFENLGATRLFIDTAQMLIEARDEAGMRHSIRIGALHFEAAVTSANELSSVKGETGR